MSAAAIAVAACFASSAIDCHRNRRANARPLAAKELDRYFKHKGVRSVILYGTPNISTDRVETDPISLARYHPGKTGGIGRQDVVSASASMAIDVRERCGQLHGAPVRQRSENEVAFELALLLGKRHARQYEQHSHAPRCNDRRLRQPDTFHGAILHCLSAHRGCGEKPRIAGARFPHGEPVLYPAITASSRAERGGCDREPSSEKSRSAALSAPSRNAFP